MMKRGDGSLGEIDAETDNNAALADQDAPDVKVIYAQILRCVNSMLQRDEERM
ncbi:MAG: hypothetical protein IJ899_15200 [Blautia sp.]|nr:hypothetical protein [Blautia sp.]